MDDYAYINARIRAMEGKLLDRARYQTLVAQQTVEGVQEWLKSSPYAACLEWTTGKPGSRSGLDIGARMDEAFRRDMVRTLSKLRRMTAHRARELMEALLIRWDAYNLKMILRGKRAHAPIEELLALTMPVGTLDEVALAELARAQTLRAVADTLETWRSPLARPLRDGLKALGDSDVLQPLEFALDRFVLRTALQVTADGSDDDDLVLKDYLRLLVDKTNLLTAFRYLEERSALSGISGVQQVALSHEAGRYYLDAGGRVTPSLFRSVVGAGNLRHGLALLAETPYRWLAGRFAETDPVSVTRMEGWLDRWLLHEAIGLARRDPLGIGVATAYIERKVNEARNLRLIVRGKASGMGPDHLMAWLIV